MTLVWKTGIGPATKRLVLLALADSANDEGVCWPSMETLARKSNCGVSSARRACQELEADGVLQRDARGKDGRQQSNLYTISRAALEGAQIERVPKSSGTGRPNLAGGGAQIERQNPKREPKEETPTPPGGDASAAPEEETSLPPAEDGGLFDDAPFRPEPEPAPPRPFSAADVVAAYVDSYRQDSGKDPLASSIKMVGAHAKRLLKDGVEQGLLLTAAQRLGRTAYASLDREVAMIHRGGQASPVRGTRRPLGVVHTPEERQEQRDWFAEQRALQEKRRRVEGNANTTSEENAQ